MGWNAWLQALGSSLHIDHGDTFTDAQMLYQATVEGQGICLGWAGLLDLPLKQGLLIRPLDISVRTGQSFYIIAARGEPLSLHARALRDWMLEQGKVNRRD